VHKQALLLESGLNRLALQAEIQRLRAVTTWAGEATRASRHLAPLVLLLAPLAGFLVARRGHRSHSWLGRLAAAIRWIAPLYRIWKILSPARSEAPAERPAA
jgi:hypothetical protein